MDAFSVAASGLRSAELRLSASAHNVANLTTPSFRPLRAEQTSVEGGGSSVELRQAASPQEVDLARELIQQILATSQFDASLRVLAVATEMRGQLLDQLA